MKNFNLPKDHRPYIDKYFLRAKEILEKDELNPMVKVQVFIRRGDCKVYGIDEAIAILCKYSDIQKTGHIYALKEGSLFAPGEIAMLIEAPIQSIIDLETMYLGVLSAETTLKNGGKDIDTGKINQKMDQIVELSGKRPVSYFGARHWRFDRDLDIAVACCTGGATNCSTDEGAKAWGKDCKGIGTIPHALEAIYHWQDGLENTVYAATHAFEKHMHPSIPRIALVDYANREILDSLDIAPIVNGIRIDTCGENYMQGVIGASHWSGEAWFRGKGVSLNGVYLIKKLLNDSGYKDVKIILSSGFGNPDKVRAFIDAEKGLKTKLFDSLGIGGVFESRMATADIISVGGEEIHKVGRGPKPVNRLRKVF